MCAHACVCVHMCVCVCASVYVCMHMITCMYICLCISSSILCVCVCIHACMRACKHGHMCVCVHVFVRMHVSTCMQACVSACVCMCTASDRGHHSRWADSGETDIYSAGCHLMFAPHCLFELVHVFHGNSLASAGLSPLPPPGCSWTEHLFGGPDVGCTRSHQPEEFITYDQNIFYASSNV